MKKILTNYRYYVLFALFATAIMGILSEGDDALTGAEWFNQVISQKVVGIAAAVLCVKLYKYWVRKGSIAEIS